MTEAIFEPIAPELDPELAAVIGTGPLAQAAARILALGRSKVRMYSRRADSRDLLEPDLGAVDIITDLQEAIRGAAALFLALPAGELEEIGRRIGPLVVPDQVVLIASRGVTEGFRLPHEHIRAQTSLRKIGVLGGPLHVRELAAGRRINVVIASRFGEVFDVVARLTRGAPVSFHPTRDVIGVEIAGAIANVASIAAGMAETLSLGDTARGVLLAHGVIEARVLGVAHGADRETFAGLTGLGELIPRAIRSMERHIELGRRLAEGASVSSVLEAMDGHVEGVLTAREARRRAEALKLELPLVSAVAAVMDERADPRARLEAVLARPLPLDRS